MQHSASSSSSTPSQNSTHRNQRRTAPTGTPREDGAAAREHQNRMRCGSVGRASDRDAADVGLIPRAARDFLPRVNFQCRLIFNVRTPPCAIACINISAHVKNSVVHVKSSVDYGNTNVRLTNHSDKIINLIIVVAQ